MKKIISLLLTVCFSGSLFANYTGRLSCDSLPSILGWMNGEVAIQCRVALESCVTKKNLEKLTPDHPLYNIMKARAEDYISLGLEICELAIYSHNKSYYSEHLKRK
jgi:hypothetical protein